MESESPLLHENLPILEVVDPFILDQLFADPTSAACLLQRLSPLVAVVDPPRFDALAARLRSAGHLPKIVG